MLVPYLFATWSLVNETREVFAEIEEEELDHYMTKMNRLENLSDNFMLVWNAIPACRKKPNDQHVVHAVEISYPDCTSNTHNPTGTSSFLWLSADKVSRCSVMKIKFTAPDGIEMRCLACSFHICILFVLKRLFDTRPVYSPEMPPRAPWRTLNSV